MQAFCRPEDCTAYQAIADQPLITLDAEQMVWAKISYCQQVATLRVLAGCGNLQMLDMKWSIELGSSSALLANSFDRLPIFSQLQYLGLWSYCGFAGDHSPTLNALQSLLANNVPRARRLLLLGLEWSLLDLFALTPTCLRSLTLEEYGESAGPSNLWLSNLLKSAAASLRELSVSECFSRDAGFASGLQHLDKLQSLTVYHEEDDTFRSLPYTQYLGSLKSLETLSVDGFPPTAADLAILASALWPRRLQLLEYQESNAAVFYEEGDFTDLLIHFANPAQPSSCNTLKIYCREPPVHNYDLDLDLAADRDSYLQLVHRAHAKVDLLLEAARGKGVEIKIEMILRGPMSLFEGALRIIEAEGQSNFILGNSDKELTVLVAPNWVDGSGIAREPTQAEWSRYALDSAIRCKQLRLQLRSALHELDQYYDAISSD